MLNTGRVPATPAEHNAIDDLIAKHTTDGAATITRRDPGETGPLLLHIGADTWLISRNGRAKKLT